jgi:hypothetical protein
MYIVYVYIPQYIIHYSLFYSATIFGLTERGERGGGGGGEERGREGQIEVRELGRNRDD